MKHEHITDARKRPVNLTIRADLLEQARLLNLNTSRAAEAGISAAVKAAREKAWREENKPVQLIKKPVPRHRKIVSPGTWATTGTMLWPSTHLTVLRKLG